MRDMTDITVNGGLTQDNAILLLAAAEELGEDASVVRTTAKGFIAPKKVVDKAGLEGYDPDAEFNAEIEAARGEVEAKPEPEDGVIAAGEVPPTLDDDNNLVVVTEDETDAAEDEVTEEPVDDEPKESTVEEQTETVEDADKPPAKSDNKAAWAKYAKDHGETDESLTKEALVAKYGTKE